jgi:hypothetical protein
MIHTLQMTNKIISDTKVIFTHGNAVIQFALAAGLRPADLSEQVIGYDMATARSGTACMLASPIWERALAVFGGQEPAKLRYQHYCFVSMTLYGLPISVPDDE